MLYELARLVLGLLFLVFGLNGFFHFRSLPPMNEVMMKFNASLQDTKIILPVVKIFEIVFGLALILNRWTLLATLALSPICFFIVVAHLAFNRPKGWIMAVLIGVCSLILLEHHMLALSFLFQP